MALKKLSEKLHKVYLYGIKKEVRYKGFTTKQQEILLECQPLNEIEQGKDLTAKQTKDIINGICQIAQACVVDEIDIMKLSYSDLTHLFMMLRKVSVGETVDVKYQLEHTNVTDEKDRYEIVSASVNIDDINFDIIDESKLCIVIDNDDGIDYKVYMKYPDVQYMIDEINQDTKKDIVPNKLFGLLVGVEMDDEFILKDDIELKEWVEVFNTFGSLNQAKFINFLNNIPDVEHSIVLKSKKFPDVVKEVKLKGIESFF